MLVPAGVGALAAASVAYYRRPDAPDPPTLVCVEPADAACVLASCVAGDLTYVPGPHRSIMVGLNCGNASPIAWPVISIGLDWLTAIPDTRAEDAMRLLAAEGIEAGETGSAALGGCARGRRRAPSVTRSASTAGATVLLLCTEGVTDPVNYEKIVGHPPSG